MFPSDFRKIAVHLFVIFVKFARGYIVMCVMDIVKLQGTDRKLYEFVCPLVMNPAILRQNNNYPFKTGPRDPYKQISPSILLLSQKKVSDAMVYFVFTEMPHRCVTKISKKLLQHIANGLRKLHILTW